MSAMPIRWKVKPILEAHETSTYRFWKASELSRDVAYAIANGTHPALDAGVIEKVVPYLRDLTQNEALQIGDVVEYVGERA
ncbi:helix-turn-helix domain-containing protein [Coleofasciculus sp. H7-2]|uniref:helix-turn-helix domain-containing protein n=1 Tax=Coleofasciculus sp. H7-2 TaxID=3351545 RepID=UPI00366ABBCD